MLIKTNFILFGNRKNNDNVRISMNKYIITRVCATKFLGVIIDERLTWKDHISLVRSMLASFSCQLQVNAARVSHFLDAETEFSHAPSLSMGVHGTF